MKALRHFSNSTLGLAFALGLGIVAGTLAPPAGAPAYIVGQIYLALVNMAALPLLVVALFFGLRQLLTLAHPEWRVGSMLSLSLALVALCAVGGTLIGLIAGPGAHLGAGARAHLGQLVMQSTSDAEDLRMSLFGTGGSARVPATVALRELAPDNFYRVLADGRTLGVLTCTVLFGMAIATLSSAQSRVLHNVFEGIYRTFELIIEHANLLLPVLVFGSAAHVAGQTSTATLGAMSGFLLWFLLGVLTLSAAAVAAIAARAHAPLLRVMSALKPPMLVGLTSGSATATIAHTIEAMSTRLGFSRGVAELVVPFGAVFVRAGSALYFALATLFVANLYGRSLGAGDIAMVAAASTFAAFVSAGRNGVAGIGYAGLVLSTLQLPIEAAGVLFVAVDLICEGPRNLLSLLSVCLVVALVSAGLPTERTAPTEGRSMPQPDAVFRLVFTRIQLALASACVVTVGLLIVMMGIGVGAK